jgi:hypothetical protein
MTIINPSVNLNPKARRRSAFIRDGTEYGTKSPRQGGSEQNIRHTVPITIAWPPNHQSQ